MAVLDKLYYRMTANSGRILFILLGVQTLLALTTSLLVSLNSYAVYSMTNAIEVCTLYMTADKFADPILFLQDAGCRTSINSGLTVLAMTVAIICYHFYAERSGKMAQNIYSNVQQRWYWSFAICGAVVALTVLIFAINTSAGLSATCGSVGEFTKRFSPGIDASTVSCSKVIDSDGVPRHSRLSIAVAFSWISIMGWGAYIAMYVAAARSY
ncbi:hypothetical protein H9P43_005003 [Blastocladiella emersonii ATCC 22665]|nr:hypothetical protein H9P43_005003 [Blastocladiella emersonii ATCC 22665]